MKKNFLFLFFLWLAVFPAIGQGKQLTVLYTGDMAGNVEPCG